MTWFNHLSILLPSVVSPVGITLVLLLIARLARYRRWLRRGSLSLAIMILLVFSLPVTSVALIASLEDRYPVYAMADVPEADLIILLGGAVNIPTQKLTRPEIGPSGDRLVLTHALWQAGKAPRILISAGNIVTPEGLASEAEYTADILTSWGIPESAILLETTSGNTYENARYSSQAIDTGTDATRLLVTSAFHMPRARALFCHAGVDTIGVTANHWLNGTTVLTLSNWFPNAIALAGSSRVLREYLGIAVYAALGRIDTQALAHDRSCSTRSALS